jgi:glutamyl-tRNA reductase
MDAVLVRSDGLPTFHFANVIDDHLMGTTVVVRAGDWMSSLPLHIALWEAMDWSVPKYLHLPALQVLDEGNSKRALSKNKDKEADIEHYLRQGRPADAVIEYLLNIANSTFERWRAANQDAPWQMFPFDPSSLQSSSALLDEKKLENIARTTVARSRPDAILTSLVEWASVYATDWTYRLTRDTDYTLSIIRLGTEGRRKDFASWQGFADGSAYFFDDLYARGEYSFAADLSSTSVRAILGGYLSSVDTTLPRAEWWNSTVALAHVLGFGSPEEVAVGRSAGTIADFAAVIRMALTKRSNAPDLHAVQSVLGPQRVRLRLRSAMDWIASTPSHSVSDRVVKLASRIHCLFMDHHTVGKDVVRRSLPRWRAIRNTATPAAITLSTCLRLEHYYVQPLTDNIDTDRYSALDGVEAIRRFLRVSSGADSELLGEGEIMLQVNEAISEAYERGALSMDDHDAFGELLCWVRDAKLRTGFTTTSNYGNSAVNLVHRQVDWSKNPVVMLVGTGQVALSIVRALSDVAGRLVLVARNLAKAERFRSDELATMHTVTIAPTDAPRLFPIVDVLFTAVASQAPLFSSAAVATLPNDAIVVDLSYPSVFESAKSQKHFDLTNTNMADFSAHRPELACKRALMESIDDYVQRLVAIRSR